jgi:hypothetical protein
MMVFKSKAQKLKEAKIKEINQELAEKQKEIDNLESGESSETEPDEEMDEAPETPSPKKQVIEAPDKQEVLDMVDGHLVRVSQLLGLFRGMK